MRPATQLGQTALEERLDRSAIAAPRLEHQLDRRLIAQQRIAAARPPIEVCHHESGNHRGFLPHRLPCYLYRGNPCNRTLFGPAAAGVDPGKEDGTMTKNKSLLIAGLVVGSFLVAVSSGSAALLGRTDYVTINRAVALPGV